ncbi:uncharacterized protein LOC117642639 isoform X2 [Thrips palmi]|uniref:Uncharacterized protein LOC117642639 isoform X2 n=1 Tax=Thrips palmi TaxID=161013 RepID=A0A6P8YIR6_THRPL|nr:uncharacterized protein LOC117642639 isoform X2 [Thrips palmi]
MWRAYILLMIPARTPLMHLSAMYGTFSSGQERWVKVFRAVRNSVVRRSPGPDAKNCNLHQNHRSYGTSLYAPVFKAAFSRELNRHQVAVTPELRFSAQDGSA